MKNYHLSRGPPKCAFKVDIQKAYDTVDWNFLRTILINFGFHQVMVKWIMKCVSTASFSFNVNGSLHGYFKGKRGLYQGDPLSPYLFTMIMEVLTLMLKRNIRREEAFQFHLKCERQEIINVCFADDLFILPKSTTFFANVGIEVKNQILKMMHFEARELPVKYLGVPLISSGLFHKDCKILVQKVKNKIDDWKNKSLSFAGRIQHVASVLSPMQVYWSSIFILPKAIIKKIEAVSRGFLWCQRDMKRSKAKVKWDVVCHSKSEGGLVYYRIGNPYGLNGSTHTVFKKENFGMFQ
ncbi:putative reverse transcriptase domain, reverse transcriptase zinc-binding domain protein [Tanacetum coccineum]|uniref:Reverse transcriptase domain, reverse transcriptase zinc-binding domain protein n=1 Tax=Tanacetum coccineum TaxID=301880 RepID=A0ABQ4XBP5_9ASTR